MKIKYIFFSIFVAIFLTNCHNTTTLTNIYDTPISNKITKQQIKDAIIEAGKERGWKIQESKEPDILIGKLSRGNHYAEVAITYSEKSYSIKYKNSNNLDFNPAKATINRHYNSWIRNLNNDIQSKINLSS